MFEGINNIYKRINEIQSGSRNIGDSLKPEKVKEFENMYNEAVSKNSNATNTTKDEIIHPYLKQKEIENVSSVNPIENNEIIKNAVSNASKKYNLSPELINAVIKVESGYNSNSISKTGAMGLMQLMPETANEMGVDEPYDIFQNVDGGSHYLKLMLEKYNGDLNKALAAYNAGPDKVDAVNGIPDIEETKNYVKQINKILFK